MGLSCVGLCRGHRYRNPATTHVCYLLHILVRHEAPLDCSLFCHMHHVRFLPHCHTTLPFGCRTLPTHGLDSMLVCIPRWGHSSSHMLPMGCCTAECCPPGYLKIDVEGHEAIILRSMMTACSAQPAMWPRVINFEHKHVKGYDQRDLISALATHGYTVRAHYPARMCMSVVESLANHDLNLHTHRTVGLFCGCVVA